MTPIGDFKLTKTYTKDDIKIRVNIGYANKRLSFTGDIYENHRDIGGGQCYEELLETFPESAPLVELWMRWHLNDLRAGDELQESYLRSLAFMGKRNHSYGDNCYDLEKAGLLEHNGYKYGHEWKFEPVPEYVLKEIKERVK